MKSMIIFTPMYTKGIEDFVKKSAYKSIVLSYDDNYKYKPTSMVSDKYLYNYRYIFITFEPKDATHIIEKHDELRSEGINSIYILNHIDDFDFIADDDVYGEHTIESMIHPKKNKDVVGESVYIEVVQILSEGILHGCILPRRSDIGMLLMAHERKDQIAMLLVNDAAYHMTKVLAYADNE